MTPHDLFIGYRGQCQSSSASGLSLLPSHIVWKAKWMDKKLSKIQFQNYLITNYFDVFEGIFLLCPKFQLAISSEKIVIIHYMFFLVESILLPSKCVNRQCVLCTITNFLLFLVFRSSCLVFSHSFSFLDNVFSLMYCREKSLVTCNQKIS